MCECCADSAFLEKIREPAVWFPVAVAIVTYFLQLWIRTIRKRREDSILAAIYLHEIKNEVEIGIERLEYLYTHAGRPYKSGEYRPLMPTQNWNGVREILPDDVFRRLCKVARRANMEGFDDIRFHLKNYYTVICKFGNDAITGVGPFDKTTARIDLDGSRMVNNMLGQAKALMEENSKRILFPW